MNQEVEKLKKGKKDWSKIKEQAEKAEKIERESLEAPETKLGLEHPDYVELEKRLTAAEQKNNEYWNQLLRFKADMENLHRRTERDVAKAHKYALEKFTLELLPIIDSLEKSLDVNADDNELFKNLRAGVELTLNMFLTAVAKFGIKQVDPKGEQFDPNFHEAMSMQKDPAVKPNTVLQVIRKGYLLNDRLIRSALVVVNG